MDSESKSSRRPLLWGAVGIISLGIALIVAALRYTSDDEATNVAADATSITKPITRPQAETKPEPQAEPHSNSSGVQTIPSGDPAITSDAATEQHPLDPVLELARTSLARLRTEVDDYTGRLIKRERIQGKLGNEVQMNLKVRTRREADGKVTRPLSAYLKFLEPKSVRGREVIWTEGANGNKLTGHEGGMLNLMRVQLEPTGMLAMIDNKYPITEIGLARLVEKLIEKGERDRRIGPCEVQIVEDQRVGDRTCRLVQVTHPEKDSRFDFHIAQIFIDVERMIPLRYAAFLWPTEPGGEPPLEEEYTYLDLKLNVGLTDADFDPDNPDYNYP